MNQIGMQNKAVGHWAWFKRMWFPLFLLVFTSKFFDYVHWNPTISGWVSYFIYGFIAFYVWCYRNRLRYFAHSPIDGLIKLYIIFGLLCLITRFVEEGATPYDERGHIVSLLIFFLFFYFRLQGISESDIIKMFTLFGLIVFAIQVVQQIFPSQAIFGVFDLNSPDADPWRTETTEIRNGLHRFRLTEFMITLFCMYYYWSKIAERITAKRILLFGIFLVSIYLYLIRQLMFASVVTLTFSFLFVRNAKMKAWVFILVIIGSFMLISYSDILFGELIDKTKQEANESNIRVLAASYFWEQTISDPFILLFGKGNSPDNNFLQEYYHFYITDVGYIGNLYQYGIFWVCVYFYSVYFVLKNKKGIPLYIKLFVFSTFINSVMIFPVETQNCKFVWIAMLYIASMHLSRINQKQI